jgi:hypothetical protein
MDESTNLLWKPLLESAAQTIVGAIGSYAFAKVVTRFYEKNTYEGAMDFWKRGIHDGNINNGDTVHFDGLISPYTQLFPGDPFDNARRWNPLYEFKGAITKNEYQAMDFYASADAALRVGSLNGETLIGLYNRYGYVGEGLIGVAPTTLIRKMLPNFFNPEFYGARVMVSGKVAKCPSQHASVAKGIAMNAGIDLDLSIHRNLWYLQVNAIKLFSKGHKSVACLLGSPWAVTESKRNQYLIQYGYISDTVEKKQCVDQITSSKEWDKAQVYYDDIDSPSNDLSFKKQFII